MSVLDRVTEAAGRWLAARTTRRTFLAGTGKVALVATGGTALAGILAGQAEARVCGQSGVSPKCPTFDCEPPSTWGWCWYASPGCCSNGGIKKICDCCRAGYPNVQGYCPAGSSVYCVVESCLEDPRVMKVPVELVPGGSLAELSLARLRARPAGSATAVVAAAADPLTAALAMPIAAHLGVPLVLADPNGSQDALLAELTRLGTTTVTGIGGLPGMLGERFTLERPVDAGDIATLSVGLGNWLLERGGAKRAYCIGAGAEAHALAGSVSALASAERAPVLISAAAAGAVASGPFGSGLQVVYVGAEAGGSAEQAPILGTAADITRALAASAVALAGTGSIALALVPADATAMFGTVLASVGGAVLVHPVGSLSMEHRDWIVGNRPRLARAEIATVSAPSLTDQGLYDLQSALNGFDAHLLVGVGGQGLPVLPQPMDERTVGKARVSGPLPEPPPTTLVARGNPNRAVGTEEKPAPAGTEGSATTGSAATGPATADSATAGSAPATTGVASSGAGGVSSGVASPSGASQGRVSARVSVAAPTTRPTARPKPKK